MEIKNRLFPYPVLCGETDDYKETTEFALEPIITETVSELVFSYEYIIKCDSLESLIRKKEAEYVLHIECSSTAFRTALKSAVPHIEYRLPKNRINGEINLVAMIVATKDILHYSSPDLNEDYVSEDITIRKGNILAYQNLPPIFISKKTEELSNTDSFISVVRQLSLDPDEIKPLSFNLTNDRIQIIVDNRTYESYVKFQGIPSIAMAFLVLPAITYMIYEASENPEGYEQYEWFQRLKHYFESQGKDFIEDILRGADNPISIAQEILQNPISNAYRELYSMEDN